MNKEPLADDFVKNEIENFRKRMDADKSNTVLVEGVQITV